jgi:spore coat protein U-like protein
MLFGLSACVVAAAAGPASATTATSNMAVSATVSSDCSISAAALAFGTYNATGSTNLDGSATLTVQCTTASSATITLGQGSNAGSGSTDASPARRLKDGSSNFLSYSLYQDSNRSTIWGNTAGTGAAYTGTGVSTSVTVYGRVTSGQNVPAGSYSDTVVATITF